MDETVTAAQCRQLFEELIGATRDRDKRLWLALDELIVATLDARDDRVDEQVAELCRHFPGLERVMMIVWEHHIQQFDATSRCDVCEPAAVQMDQDGPSAA